MKRLVIQFVLAIGLLVNGDLAAQQATTRSAKLDEFVAPLIDLQVFSGSIVVAQGNQILLERSYGPAIVEHDIPIGPTTVFRIASISKSFTKALVGRLADRKILSLDDSLSRWLPSFPSGGSITIRMLLDHRAGIPNANSLPYDEEAIGPGSLPLLVDAIAKMPLDFPPGSRQRYSNGGYAVLARIVELATGKPFGDVLEHEILRPLGLSDTRHESDGLVVKRLANGYMPSADVADRIVKAPFQDMNTKAGGGSMVSSSRDLIKWMRAIGRSDILTPQTWTALFPSSDSVFAFQGRAPGFNAYVAHDRRSDRTTIVLANNYSSGMVADLGAAAEAIATGRAPTPLSVVRPQQPNVAELRNIAGMYDIPDGTLPVPPGTDVELRIVGDHLVAYLGPTAVDVLIPQGNRRYLARALWSIVEARETGTVNSIEVRALYRDQVFTAKRITQ